MSEKLFADIYREKEREQKKSYLFIYLFVTEYIILKRFKSKTGEEEF